MEASMKDDHHGHDHNDSKSHSLSNNGQEGDTISPYAMIVTTIQELLTEKGLIGPYDIQRTVDIMESRSPSDGARVVARAWLDSEFKKRLLQTPRATVAEMGYTLSSDAELAVLENTDHVHYLVVCTLCSCYPISLLGRPPDWYKSLAYRSRAVVDPRGVMREFGLDAGSDVEIRVVDSTADIRYLVLPTQPDGTNGMGEEELSKLVTRDSMIGVAKALPPQSLHHEGDPNYHP